VQPAQGRRNACKVSAVLPALKCLSAVDIPATHISPSHHPPTDHPPHLRRRKACATPCGLLPGVPAPVSTASQPPTASSRQQMPPPLPPQPHQCWTFLLDQPSRCLRRCQPQSPLPAQPSPHPLRRCHPVRRQASQLLGQRQRSPHPLRRCHPARRQASQRQRSPHLLRLSLHLLPRCRLRRPWTCLPAPPSRCQSSCQLQSPHQPHPCPPVPPLLSRHRSQRLRSLRLWPPSRHL